MSELVRGFCVLDCGGRVLGVDDCAGEYGCEGPALRLGVGCSALFVIVLFSLLSQSPASNDGWQAAEDGDFLQCACLNEMDIWEAALFGVLTAGDGYDTTVCDMIISSSNITSILLNALSRSIQQQGHSGLANEHIHIYEQIR